MRHKKKEKKKKTITKYWNVRNHGGSLIIIDGYMYELVLSTISIS